MCNKISLFLTVIWVNINVFAQSFSDFQRISSFNEQELVENDSSSQLTKCYNAPLHLNKQGKTYIILYALPNGNSIEWTKGKKMNEGDDWHFDIQHIAAQLRYVRDVDKKNNYILVYLMSHQKSWPTWKRTFPNSIPEIKRVVDQIQQRFSNLDLKIVLSGHSGGGSFIFGYIDAVNEIPSSVEKIVFLDSNYGYIDSLHKNKISKWLSSGKNKQLMILAYNDSIVIFNGKPLVSATGGTWYRSKMMQRDLEEQFSFKKSADTSFINYAALKGRVRIHLKENPRGLIYHTVQVEKNGFIYSMLFNTRYERRKKFEYFGERAYSAYIE